ncbi:unnamed protein product [Toxocara canis]|uniref:Secreted protein n=1 Tax=Toxocara canis TaxID=6265 RepID=A0A183U319_TOXCA|nr:unnamed protein product [Toxocara canis]
MFVVRFWAELFQLSADRSQWAIIYPSLLSVTVSEISRKRHAVHVTATSESRVIVDQLLDSCKYLLNSFCTPSQVTRVSSCFAYWRHHGQTYGVNVVCAEDCDRFCELSMEASRLTSFGCGSQRTNYASTAIFAKLSQIFDVQKGIVKHTQTEFTDCVIKLTNKAAVVRINRKDFSLNLVRIFFIG